MSLPTFTVTCAFAGSSAARDKAQAVLAKILWQEAPSSGVASTNKAPDVSDAFGQAIFRASATNDSWFSYGKAANSAGMIRLPVRGGTDCDFCPEPGDNFMWQAA